MIAEINTNSSIISSTITESADTVGYTLTDSMQAIWDSSAASINGVITSYGDKFADAQTTTNTALSAIKTGVQNMIAQLNKIAAANAASAATSSAGSSSVSSNSASSATTTKPTTTTNTTSSSSGDGVPKVGDKVKFVSGEYYYDSYGTQPLGYHNRGGYVYITHINKSGTHPYHISTGNKLGSGDLGWLKLEQLSGYATGKKDALKNEIAWTQEKGREFIVRPSDGAILTPIAKGDSVLNATASNNIWNMANSPADFIKDNLNLSAYNALNGVNIQNNCVQNFENITFSMPNVQNYEQLLSSMQKDKNFEKLILSMSIDRIAGKSSLAKGKAIR